MGATAGQGEGAFAVVNLNGRPATKAEVTSEVREVARLTGTTGHVTGHSMRVTGAQRLALAGISEVRISTSGRWASRAFQLYVREAVLGANGGDMALVVEENAAATAAQSQLRAASEGSHGFSVEARKVFENEVQANPAWVLAEVDLEARWRAFAGSLAREVKEASERPLPRFCVSEGCITHRIVDCRYTACGWHWSKSQCVTANDAVVSCKKCSGASIRWGTA